VTTRRAATGALEDASPSSLSPPIRHRFGPSSVPHCMKEEWESHPVGHRGLQPMVQPGGANDKTDSGISRSTPKSRFSSCKFFWNNLLGDTAARQRERPCRHYPFLPLPIRPGKVRLSSTNNPIYEYRALDLLSPNHTSSWAAQMICSGERAADPRRTERHDRAGRGWSPTAPRRKRSGWIHVGTTTAHNDSTNNNGNFGAYGAFRRDAVESNRATG